MKLSSFEELLGQGETVEVELSLIDAFAAHPFGVRMDEEMEQLIGSIRESGVIVPVILREKGDGRYETIAGHRRCFACRYLKKERIPALIREMSEEDAVVWMVDSNIQRINILPSEKARAYQMKLEALSRQGSRTDLKNADASRQVVGKWQRETAAQVGADTGDSGRKVQRYLRLNHLHPELLGQVDRKKLPFLAGVELSYLPEGQQERLLGYLGEHPVGITIRQAKELRRLGEITSFTEDEIGTVLAERKPSECRKHTGYERAEGHSEEKRFEKYFPKGYSREKKEELIEALLKKWKEGEILL